MREMEVYKLWTSRELEDKELGDELAAIRGNTDAIKDRFYRDLEFGTAGLRGVIGAGTNRMNIYTVRRATQGLANYLNNEYEKSSVAISYDSRIKSDLFAREAARVLVASGIKVYLYSELMPTPCLSYAVRELKCQSGIMVTASHNPAKYNGYKAYGPDGCQMGTDAANAVLDEVNKLDIFNDIKLVDFEEAVDNGSVEYISQDLVDGYLKNVRSQSIHPEVMKDSKLKLVFTPLNGTGNKPVRILLGRMGVQDITVVPEQEGPDGRFTTCPFPNPEITEALDLGLKLSEKIGADLLLATDPDCDRVGVAVRDKSGGYKLVSGNEMGVLLFNYICEERTKLGTMPNRPMMVKTIVTTKLIDAIAKEYGIEVIDVLTGFKFIGEQIGILEEKQEEERYIFGFEESYGYLAGSYVRDKDAVVGSMLICEIASFYQSQGLTLLDKLEEIYNQYGRYLNTQASFELEGESGMEQMREIMAKLRSAPPAQIGGQAVLNIADYSASVEKDTASGKETPITLPTSDVLAFDLENNAQVIIRPSGTEPKIKAYYAVKGDDLESAKTLDAKLKDDFKSIIGL